MAIMTGKGSDDCSGGVCVRAGVGSTMKRVTSFSLISALHFCVSSLPQSYIVYLS